MKKRFTIKKIIAVFLLGVFTLGVTPKKALHNLLANHTDNTSKSSNTKTQQLSKAGFNCQCDDLVVKSNFITTALIVVSIRPTYFSFSNYRKLSLHSLSRFFFDLRGPPSVNFQS
ncbi:MAG: hypothetical protein ABIN97_09665 [Ginsengibacter sp.]